MISLLTFLHIIGIALGVGAATVKLVLLIKCRSDRSFIDAFVKIIKPVTKLIILGLVLLTLSGIGWLVEGYPIGTLLIVKMILVAAVWVMGPIIDNVLEPKLIKNLPEAGKEYSAEFSKAQNAFLAAEVFATGLFYCVIVIWVLI